jgi:hypothetical protein
MSPVDGLVTVLVAAAEAYRGLLPLVEEEARALARADVAALADIAARREDALARLSKLERERTAALGWIAAAHGVSPATLTVSRLADLSPGHAPALRRVGAELREVLARLVDRHGKNRFVAERTLACLRGLFQSVAAAVAPGQTYTRGGRADVSGDGLQLIDRRA